MSSIAIREAITEDSPALIDLERLSPEVGRAAVRMDMRVDHFALAARYPDSRGYVAVARDNSTIIGTIFSSTSPTQINGRVVPATYLFSLRVHPEHRRQGIATSLIDYACERASVEAGARTFWAAIIEGNDASLRTFERADFARLRDLSAKVIFGGLALPRRLPKLSTRSASLKDLPALADAFNRYYSGHNFWRPKAPERLRAELELPFHSLNDVVIAFKEDETVLAAASAMVMNRLARLQLVGLGFLPERANRLVAPLSRLSPISTILIRNCVFPPDRPDIGAALIQALHRRYFPSSWTAIATADSLDPAWRALRHLMGITGRVHLVARSDEPIDQGRPSHLS